MGEEKRTSCAGLAAQDIYHHPRGASKQTLCARQRAPAESGPLSTAVAAAVAGQASSRKRRRAREGGY